MDLLHILRGLQRVQKPEVLMCGTALPRNMSQNQEPLLYLIAHLDAKSIRSSLDTTYDTSWLIGPAFRPPIAQKEVPWSWMW